MNEMFDYTWTLIETRPATAEEAEYTFGCQVSIAEDGCPCCTCSENITLVETFARPRYSKSSKRIVEELESVLVCSAHAE